MLNIEITTVSIEGFECANPNCKHLPEYIEYLGDKNIEYHEYIIKPNTVCARITSNNASKIIGFTEFYCRDCIDDLYQMIKSKLDTNLWAFQ